MLKKAEGRHALVRRSLGEKRRYGITRLRHSKVSSRNSYFISAGLPDNTNVRQSPLMKRRDRRALRATEGGRRICFVDVSKSGVCSQNESWQHFVFSGRRKAPVKFISKTAILCLHRRQKFTVKWGGNGAAVADNNGKIESAEFGQNGRNDDEAALTMGILHHWEPYWESLLGPRTQQGF